MSVLSIMVNPRTLIGTSIVSNAKLAVLTFQVTRSPVQFWPLMNNRVAQCQWKNVSQEKYFKIFYQLGKSLLKQTTVFGLANNIFVDNFKAFKKKFPYICFKKNSIWCVRLLEIQRFHYLKFIFQRKKSKPNLTVYSKV